MIPAMARLLEYQAKALLREHGLAVPAGVVARSVDEALAAGEQLSFPLMVKAQVPSGSRGRAGLIRPARDRDELASAAAALFGARVHGAAVQELLVEQRLAAEQEVYAAVTADPTLRKPVALYASAGGIDVEAAAGHDPDGVRRRPIDILRGLEDFEARNLLRGLAAVRGPAFLRLAELFVALYRIYRRYDCRLVEVNPLALVDGTWIALDARLEVDGDALFRHPELAIESADEAGARPATALELAAGRIDRHDHRGSVHFVQLDPDGDFCRAHGYVPIGLHCVGTGTSLTVMDEMVPLSYYPVSFTDTSGNPTASKLYRAVRIVFSQPALQGYLFVSCISSQQLDLTARGIIKAFQELFPQRQGQPDIPCVLVFRGSWDAQAIRLFADHGISAGRWVRVLGPEADERSAARVFDELYREWRSHTEP
jgi:succinyl-CoA synthetase beta subunit